MGEARDVNYYLKSTGLDSDREKEIGQHIGYRYDVNLPPDYALLTPFLKGLHRGDGLAGPELAGRRAYGIRRREAGGFRPEY